MSEQPCLVLTGGTGFVGRRFARRLATLFSGHRRVIVAQVPGAAEMDGWSEELIDLAQESAVDNLIKRLRPEIVVHLAAQSSVGQAAHDAVTTWDVNFCGSFFLAKAIAEHTPGSLLFFTSSAEVYGASFNAGPAREDTPTAPVNSYAVAKLAAERMFDDVLPQQTQLIITRSFNHSGAGQDERFVLPSFAAQIARAEAGLAPPRIAVGNLAAERDFLHVDDVVEAYALLLGARDSLPRRVTVNVASGQAWQLSSLLEILLARSSRPIEIVSDPDRLRSSDIPRVVGDASRLRELTGWQPRRSVEDILQELLCWFRSKTGT